MPARVRGLGHVGRRRVGIGVGVGVEDPDHRVALGLGGPVDAQVLLRVDGVDLGRRSHIACGLDLRDRSRRRSARRGGRSLPREGPKAVGDHLVS